MFNKNIVSFLLLIIAAGVLIAPAYAQSTNYTISGNITFPTETNYNNVTVSDLTITVYDMTGFAAAKTNPAADGTFSISVANPGTYNISVYPHELNLANITTNTSYLYQYPDNQLRFQSVIVSNKSTPATVQVWGAKVLAPTATTTVNYPPSTTPTATPSPGFGLVLIVVGLIGAAAVVTYTRK
jgi:hypothetical protein